LFDEYGLDNCFIELLEAKACNSKDELKQLEGEYIRNLICVNKRVENRNHKESVQNYRINNREKYLEQCKQYHENNKEASKQYYQVNKEQIIEKSKQHYNENKEHVLERNKQYYKDNKDIIIEKQKQYSEKNKDKISELNKRVFECSCGKTYTHCNKSRHNKSAFHINNKKE